MVTGLTGSLQFVTYNTAPLPSHFNDNVAVSLFKNQKSKTYQIWRKMAHNIYIEQGGGGGGCLLKWKVFVGSSVCKLCLNELSGTDRDGTWNLLWLYFVHIYYIIFYNIYLNTGPLWISAIGLNGLSCINKVFPFQCPKTFETDCKSLWIPNTILV